MKKEFSSILYNYHTVLRVSLKFMGGRLSKCFMSITCPDPFCGEDGPTPQGSVAVFCIFNNPGTAIQHYHISFEHLSPTSPCKKNQYYLILNRPRDGQVGIITRCNIKKNTTEVHGLVDALHFDQICLVTASQKQLMT